MTVSIVPAATNMIVETKITRTEMLDLILDDLTSELQTQIDAAEAKLEAVPTFDQVRAEQDAFVALMPKDVEVEVDESTYGEKKGSFKVSIEFYVKANRVPAAYLKREKQRDELRKVVRELNSQHSKLTQNKQKAKNEIIRRSLEGTPDGRALLDSLTDFKVALKAKLLKGG